MRFKRLKLKGFSTIELLAVIFILSIISLIGMAVQIGLEKNTRKAYYYSLEGTVSLAGRDYFSDNIDERPVDTDYASLIEINGRKTQKNLEKQAYVSKVLDMKERECPGKVISYLDVDGEYTYVSCLECSDYKSTDRICGCKEETIVDEETGETYTICKLDEIPKITIKTVYKDNPNEIYKSFGSDGEDFGYDDAIWTSRNLQITYTTNYQYAKKIRVVNEEGDVVTSMSCNEKELEGTTTKTCTKTLNETLYGQFTVSIVDDLNRNSKPGERTIYIKIDKTKPNITLTPYNTIGQLYTYNASKASEKNLNLTLKVTPTMAPSGYTYKWYYSTDLTNGSNRVLITQVKVEANGERTVISPKKTTGEEDESGYAEGDEITNIDTSQGVVGYRIDPSDMSLFINAPRQKLIARKYILEITTGAGLTGTKNQNIRINRPKAICNLTAKKASGANYQSDTWSNEDVLLTCDITNNAYVIKRWTKKPNVSGGEKTNIQNTSKTIRVSSISNNAGDIYTAVFGLVDNTEQEESEEFVIKIDKAAPKCGSVSGSSTSWKKGSRKITVKCSDDLSGCKESSVSKTFTGTIKTSSITIKDKAGNSKSCSVNVYLDNTDPSVSMSCSSCSGSGTGRTCTCTVSASDSHSGVSYKKYASGYTCGSYKTYSKGYIFYPNKYVTCAYAVDKVGNKSKTVSK